MSRQAVILNHLIFHIFLQVEEGDNGRTKNNDDELS